MRKLIALLMVSIVGVSVSAVAAGGTPLPDLVCGQPITGSVRLTHDLTCTHGFLVTMPTPFGRPRTPVTVDLEGHTLALSDPSAGVFCAYGDVLVDARGFTCPITAGSGVVLTVENGTVAGSLGTTDGGLVLSRVHVEGRVFLSPNANDEVRGSRIDGRLEDATGIAPIRHNVILGGIVTDDSFVNQQLTITDNLIANSPGAGITIYVGFTAPDVTGTIADNIIYQSAGSGISAAGSNLKGLTIQHNWLVANLGDGITLGPPHISAFRVATATLTGNVAAINGGHGFNLDPKWYSAGYAGEPQPRFIDGGQNIAIGNATSPQCIGLACKP